MCLLLCLLIITMVMLWIDLMVNEHLSNQKINYFTCLKSKIQATHRSPLFDTNGDNKYNFQFLDTQDSSIYF